MESFDLVVVGGGIGGAALATVLARAGLGVLVLEKSTVYRDHVRGEWMAPWGVRELQTLGLYDDVVAGGGHHLKRHWSCDEGVPHEDAIARALDLSAIVPGVSGPLCIGHPRHCQLLIDLAAAAGATVRRGVSDVRVEPGTAPEVEYAFEGDRRRVRGRLVAGADGRGSQVARRLGFELERDPTHHLFSGMLIEGAQGWPDDLQVIGSEKDVHYLAFPQGNGRVRLYLGYSCDQPRRLAGAGGPKAFLDAFRLESVPGSEHLAGAEPAGPCHSYPNEDTWIDVLHKDSVFLVGDAAGSNDPIIGQGLSITMRDVRLVRDALLGEKDWSRGDLFAEYAAERRERMRRLRFSASLMSTLQNEFGEAAAARRRRALERHMRDPMLLLPFLATLAGPETPPAEAFDPSIRERLFG